MCKFEQPQQNVKNMIWKDICGKAESDLVISEAYGTSDTVYLKVLDASILHRLC